MTAYTSSPGIEGYPLWAAAIPHGESAGTRKVAFDFDWAAITKARANANLPALAAGDVVTIGTLPAGCMVMASASNVTIANTAAAAISVGVAGTAGAFAAAVATGTVGWAPGAVAPLPYAVNTDIILTLTAVPLAGKTRVVLTVADMA